MKKVLIAGGSGLIGSNLAKTLVNNGYSVSILSRSKDKSGLYPISLWDPSKGVISEEAVREASIIVNLAGAGIGDQRWSPQRKKELLESRIQSTRLLVDTIIKTKHQPDLFVQGSAIGIYGDRKSEWLNEEDVPGSDFLAEICQKWETEALRLSEHKIPLFISRTGIVLSRKGGALPKLDRTASFGFLNYLGDGEQFYSWIHEEDMTGILQFAIENKLQGIFNSVGPEPLSNKAFVQTLGQVKNASIIIPAPSFAIQLAMGEMAVIVLASQRCSAEKIQQAGYHFLYPNLKNALADLYSTSN